jgi:oligogalacturonide transport system substrate-binding protein
MPTEPITFSFAWWGNDDRAAAVEAAINEFTSRYPNITIEPEPNSAAFAAVTEAMVTRMAAGTEADFNQVNYSWVHSFGRGRNVFADLRQFDDIIDFSEFSETDIALMTLDGGQIGGVSHNMNARMLLTNTVMLQEFGLTELPASFDDFVALAGQISANNIEVDAGDNRYAHVPFSNLDIDHYVLAMFYSMTGKENVVDGKFNYTVDEVRAVLDNLVRFDAAGGQPSHANHDPINNRENSVWTSGRALSSFQWINNPHVDSAPYGGGDRVDEFTLFPFPQPGDKVVAVARPGLAHAISRNTKHPEVVAYFLNYFYSDPAAIKAVGTQLGIPSARTAYQIVVDEGMVHPLAALGLELLNKLPVGPMGAFWEDSTLREPRYALYDELRTGRLTTQQAAERLVGEQQEALDVIFRQ